MSFLHTGITTAEDFPLCNPHDHALARVAVKNKNGGVRFACPSGGEAAGRVPIARRNE